MANWHFTSEVISASKEKITRYNKYVVAQGWKKKNLLKICFYGGQLMKDLIFQITCLHLVASLLVFLLKRDVLDKPECKSVHHIWTGAAALSPKVQLLALEKLSRRAILHHSYGLTETTFTMFTCVVGPNSLGTPGRLTPGMECKVFIPS